MIGLSLTLFSCICLASEFVILVSNEILNYIKYVVIYILVMDIKNRIRPSLIIDMTAIFFVDYTNLDTCFAIMSSLFPRGVAAMF